MRPAWIAMALAACAGSPADVSYRSDVQPIWDRWCVGCHIAASPRLTSNLSAEELAGESWHRCRDGVARAPFVVAGDPDASFLVFKLTGANPAAYWTGEACARPMPADDNGGGTPLMLLDAEAVATVRRWIEQGARFD